jgi:hypothetical protein
MLCLALVSGSQIDWTTSKMNLSPQIIGAPIILFLGAGASQPLGKPTIKPFVQGLQSRLSGDKQRLLKHLISKCGDDLEEILAELDAVINLRVTEEIHTFVQGGSSAINVKRVGQELRYAIEYQIIQEYSDIPTEKVTDLYEPLFDCIFSSNILQPILPIFTTNYDRSIEDFCEAASEKYELTDGFSACGREFQWSPRTFHNLAPPKRKRKIVLFKLHDSVDWIYLKSKKAIVRTQPFHEAIDLKRYQNVLIYPAVHKVATDDPYFTAYDYYGRCCEHSKMLLTIGYSFRDYDALARLRSAAAFNPDLAVCLVDPFAKDILNKLGIDSGRAVPIEHNFGGSETLSLIRDVVLNEEWANGPPL